MKLITTSWDDGYPDDFRIAELLDKYNIDGTFYIPKTNEAWPVMPESDIQQLAERFEIGGHTIHHVPIRTTAESFFEEEIQGCYDWLTDLLGEKPDCFCFPRGEFNRPAIDYFFKCGIQIIENHRITQPRFRQT